MQRDFEIPLNRNHIVFTTQDDMCYHKKVRSIAHCERVANFACYACDRLLLPG